METILENLEISEVVTETAADAGEDNASTTSGVDLEKFDSFVAIGIAKDLADAGTVSVRLEEYDGSDWNSVGKYAETTNDSGSDVDSVAVIEEKAINLSDDAEQIRAVVWQDDGAIEQTAVLAQGNPVRTDYVDNPGDITEDE